MRRTSRPALACILLAVLTAGRAPSQSIATLNGVDFEQHLGAQVPLDASFVDEQGRTTTIGACLHGRPAVFALVYYECPMLCSLIMNGIVRSLKAVSLDAGKDFDVVIASIDPGETPELAAGTKQTLLERYDRPDTASGFHLLTGTEPEIKRVADAVGYRYRYDPETDQYAHAAGIVILTPDGGVSRYLFGVDYPPRDLKLALVDSSKGEVGSLTDKLLLFCFHYDPETGRYGLAIMSAIRVGGILTLGGLGFFIFRSVRRDRRVKQGEKGPAS